MRSRHGDKSSNVSGGEKGSAYDAAHGMTHDNDLGVGRVAGENVVHRRRCVGNLRIKRGAMECGKIFIELHCNVIVLGCDRDVRLRPSKKGLTGVEIRGFCPSSCELV